MARVKEIGVDVKDLMKNFPLCKICERRKHNCICTEELVTFFNEETTLQTLSFSPSHHDKFPVLLFKISNLVVCASLIGKDFDDEVQFNLSNLQFIFDDVRKTFNNCMTITHTYNGTKVSTKIFTNGRIQMAIGSGNISLAMKELWRIYTIIKFNKNAYIVDADNFEKLDIYDVKVILANSNFDIGPCIKQTKMKDALVEKYRLDATFNPDKYPGINLKLEHVSVFIFKSGKIIITASKTVKGLKDAYLFINTIIKNEKHDICYIDPIEIKKKALKRL